MSAPNVIVHSLVVKTFHSEPQMSSSWWHEQRSQGITKVIRIIYLESINISTNFFLPIYLETVEIFHWISPNFDVLVVLKEK